MKRKKTEKKLKRIDKKLLKLSKKGKLVAKLKGVKKNPALKVINKEKTNGGENIQTPTSIVETTKSH